MAGTEADYSIPGASSVEVPALVRRYLDRALAPGAAPSRVRVTQAGEMWLKPGGRALRFEAVEEFAVDEVAFSWRARFPIVPLLSLRVLDRYAAGEGELEARLFGLPLMRARGQATAEGEAMRYLAELPWVPHAMAANRQLEWCELDQQTVEVATLVGLARVAVRLEFNAEGDIVGASADARPRPEGKTIVPRPWGGVFADHAVVGGIRVPRQAEVRWDLPEGSFTYWRGVVTSLELES
jgi:hypothetical protein